MNPQLIKRALSRNERDPFHIRMNRELSDELMIQARRDGKTASDILTELTIGYLEKRLSEASLVA